MSGIYNTISSLGKSWRGRDGSAWPRVVRRTILELHRQLQAASAACAKLGGRVHLVKNVYATPEQLYAMYTDAMERFLRLKAQLDPEGILHNSFFDRIFGYAKPFL